MLWISVGKSKKDTKWKPTEISWKDLVDRLKKPVRTSETMSQYLKFSKERRDEIKDVGGYVGGVVSGGNRLARSVQSRSLLTLDIDQHEPGLWDDFCMTWACSAVMHATHSSTPSALRFRLIIPLAHDVHTDEYEAISRWVAGTLGIDLFDKTTFEPSRLMFWPSVSSNADYLFYHQAGKPLNPEQVLSMYQDWRDISQWPVHSSVEKLIKKDLSKQEDPLTKPGVIGAFCRTYSISEVIEKYLSNVYEPTGDNRYTFKAGSTAGGLIVYDDKFAYSHHGTDPVSNKLVNAFDLLRLSLYHDSDEGVSDGTNTTKLPSYTKAVDLIIKDGAVKKELLTQKLSEAKGDFGEPLTDGDSSEDGGSKVEGESSESGDGEGGSESDKLDWLKRLEVDKRGECYSTTQNIVIILENDPKLKGRFMFDDFNKRVVISKNTFWKKIKRAIDSWITDSDLSHIRHYLETVYKIVGKDRLEDALVVVSRRNKFHPVKMYLESLTWDGTERLDKMLVTWLGAEDNLYVRSVTRKTMVAAVTRVYEPGCKFDTMPILKGTQGLGKSKLLRLLGGEWFSDTLGPLNNKDSMHQLQGVWIMEMPELSDMKRAEVETMKAFVSKEDDRFRIAFGRTVESYPRQNIFIGTTNEDEFLKDQTGNRRFWPIILDGNKATKDVFKMSARDRDQLWAEAVYYYVMGEDLYLTGEVNQMAIEVQDRFTEKETFTNIIQKYLSTPVPKNWYQLKHYDRLEYLNSPDDNMIGKPELLRYKITVEEIWLECVKGQIKDMNRFNITSIKNSMKKIKGWEHKVIKIEGEPVRGWYNSVNKLLKEDFTA